MERAFIICGKLVTKIEAQFLTSAEFLLQFNYNFWRQQNFNYNLIAFFEVIRIFITIVVVIRILISVFVNKLPPYTPAGFDFTTHNPAGRDDTTRLRYHGTILI
jgi:hypothetical protein